MKAVFCFLFSCGTLFQLLSQAPPSIQQKLASRGIGISTEALIAALNDPRPEVRGLAAGQLAEDKDYDAAAAIATALDHEQVPEQRLNMARSLSALDDPRGRLAYVDLCESGSAPADLRLMAANEIAPQDEGCSTSVVNMFAQSRSALEQLTELNYLLKRSAATGGAFAPENTLAVGLRTSLKSPVASVRDKAARCIAKYQTSELLEELQLSIAREADPAVKISMENAARRLANMKHP